MYLTAVIDVYIGRLSLTGVFDGCPSQGESAVNHRIIFILVYNRRRGMKTRSTGSGAFYTLPYPRVLPTAAVHHYHQHHDHHNEYSTLDRKYVRGSYGLTYHTSTRQQQRSSSSTYIYLRVHQRKNKEIILHYIFIFVPEVLIKYTLLLSVLVLVLCAVHRQYMCRRHAPASIVRNVGLASRLSFSFRCHH